MGDQSGQLFFASFWAVLRNSYFFLLLLFLVSNRSYRHSISSHITRDGVELILKLCQWRLTGRV